MNALCLKDISFGYEKNKLILRSVSLEVEKGEAVAIKGESGSGKSTLGMVACGVIPKMHKGYFSGRVSALGEDIADKAVYETADKISMVFQEPESQLFAPAVIDEVAFAPENLCLDQKEIMYRIHSALGSVGMAAFSDYSPTALSGGQQQLVVLASILSLNPQIIILDEVTAGIDPQGIGLLQNVVKRLKEQGKTLIIIEHEDFLSEYCDKIYMLRSGSLVKSDGHNQS